MKLHLFAHNSKNYVVTGQTVKRGDLIGAIGNAHGKWYAHLHHSISEGLTPRQLFRYVRGWTRDKVAQYYEDPAKTTDYNKMFGRKMDVGNRGWGFLQKMGWRYYHPGQDINGIYGGNTDYGYKYKSPVDGKVIFSADKWGGWGRVIIIQEEKNCTDEEIKKYKKKLKEHQEKFNHEKEKVEEYKNKLTQCKK